MAERVQLSRAKGWKMPPNTVKVDRSTRWGNPVRVEGSMTAARAVRIFRNTLEAHGAFPAIWTPARPGEPVFVEWACVRNRWHRGPHRDISGEWATEGHPKEC